MAEFRQVIHENGELSEKEIAEKAQKLCEEINLDYLLVTRSEQGMSLVEKESGHKADFPAVAQEVIDVTGAGDTVISILPGAQQLDFRCRMPARWQTMQHLSLSQSLGRQRQPRGNQEPRLWRQSNKAAAAE